MAYCVSACTYRWKRIFISLEPYDKALRSLQNVSLTWLQRGGLNAYEAYTHRESIVLVPRSSTSRCHSPTGIAICNGKSHHATHIVLKFWPVLAKHFHVFAQKNSHFLPLIQGAMVSGLARQELVLQNTCLMILCVLNRNLVHAQEFHVKTSTN